MSSELIQKMKSKLGRQATEALRQPSVKKVTADGTVGVSISYGPATSVGEEIARRFKTTMLPAVTNLCSEAESFHNMYSTTSHESETEASKQKKELKPVVDLYNALMKAQDVILDFIASRKKAITEETGLMGDQQMRAHSNQIDISDSPESGDDLEDDGDTSDEERLAEVIHQLASRNDLGKILSRVEDPGHLADLLEEAINSHETELDNVTDTREY